MLYTICVQQEFTGVDVNTFSSMLTGNSEIIMFTMQQRLASCEYEDLVLLNIENGDSCNSVRVLFGIDLTNDSDTFISNYDCVNAAIVGMADQFVNDCKRNADLTQFTNSFGDSGSIVSSRIISTTSYLDDQS